MKSKILICVLLVSIVFVVALFALRTPATVIEMEMTSSYDDADPFINEKLIYTSEDSIDFDVSFRMVAESGLLEIADNETKHVIFSKPWEGTVDDKFSFSLSELKKEHEYVIRLTCTKVESAKLVIKSENTLVKEVEKPLKPSRDTADSVSSSISASSSTSSLRPIPPSSPSEPDEDTEPVNEPVDEVITEIPSSQSSSKPDEDTIPVIEPVEEIITEIPSQPPSSAPQSSSSASQQPTQNATYRVTANPDRYETSTDSITVNITNTSDVDGGFGRYYRIEQRTDGGWVPLPLEIIVTEDWPLLPAGETQAQFYNLFQDQYDYSSGTYRIVLTGVSGEPSVVFELE